MLQESSSYRQKAVQKIRQYEFTLATTALQGIVNAAATDARTAIALTAGAFATLSAAETALMRRYRRPETIDIGSKDVSNFVTFPNPGPALLEQYLGFSFASGMEPHKILATQPSMSKYVPKNALEANIGAVYNPEYNGFFTQRPQSTIVDIHETLHGYIEQRNPYFLDQRVSRKQAINTIVWQRATPKFDAEQYILAHAINEGIAYNATNAVVTALFNDTLRKGGDLSELTADMQEHLNLNHVGSQPLVDLAFNIPVKSREQDLADMQEKIATFNDAFQLTRSRITQVPKVMVPPSPKNILWTTHFVKEVVDPLTAAGMTSGQAYMAIIDNPPTSIEQTKAPNKYVQTLLKA